MNSGLFGFSNFPTSADKDSGLLIRSQFDASGTFVIPNRCKNLLIYAICGGGGGGSGRTSSTTNNASGGSGGAGGYAMYGQFDADALGGAGTSLSIIVGAGGLGGAAVSASSTNGNDGTNGGATAIALPSGNYLFYGSHGTSSFNRNAGYGGVLSTLSSGLSGQLNMLVHGITLTSTYATRGSSGTVDNQTLSNSLLPLWGAGGGGVNASNVASAGGNINNNTSAFTGARVFNPIAASAATICAGGTADSGLAGESARFRVVVGAMSAGLSGAGGGGGVNNNGGNGGDGYRGSGGGGGGGARDGKTSGAGGNGGNGYVCIEAYA